MLLSYGLYLLCLCVSPGACWCLLLPSSSPPQRSIGLFITYKWPLFASYPSPARLYLAIYWPKILTKLFFLLIVFSFYLPTLFPVYVDGYAFRFQQLLNAFFLNPDSFGDLIFLKLIKIILILSLSVILRLKLIIIWVIMWKVGCWILILDNNVKYMFHNVDSMWIVIINFLSNHQSIYLIISYLVIMM